MLELLLELLSRLGQAASLRTIERAGRLLGLVFRLCLPGRRRLAQAAIERHLGLPAPQAGELADRCLAENCISFLEIFQTRRMDIRFIDDHVEISKTTRRNLARMSDKTRPVVIASAHLGAWELQGQIMCLFPSRPRQFVVRKSKPQSVNTLMRHMRGQAGVDVVEHRNAAGTVLRALRKGGITAFLVDHNCSRDEAVFLPFLGDVAAVNMGPALLALRAKALVFPTCLLRLGSGRYRLHVENPLDCASLVGDRIQNVTAIAQFYTQAVERFIRLAPEQWFWMHNRWKTRPPSENVPVARQNQDGTDTAEGA